MIPLDHGFYDRALRSRSLFTTEVRKLLAMRQAARAAELCRRGLVHFPEDHTGYLLLAQAYLMSGERDRALDVLADGYRRTRSHRLDLVRAELLARESGNPVVPPIDEHDAQPVQAVTQEITSDAPDAAAPSAESSMPPVDASVGDDSRAAFVAASLPAEENVASVPVLEASSHEASQPDALPLETGAHEDNVGVATETLAEETLPDAGFTQQASEESVQVVADEPAADDAVSVNPLPETVVAESPTVIAGSDAAFISTPTEPTHAAEDAVAVVDASTSSTESEQYMEPRPYAEPELHVESEPVAQAAPVRPMQMLALHTVRNATRLRSSNLRLIPGLEFAPLRREEPTRSQSIAPLISEPMPHPELPRWASRSAGDAAMPPLPNLDIDSRAFDVTMPLPDAATSDHAPAQSASPQQQYAGADVANAMPTDVPANAASRPDAGDASETAPLDELARRLENARIPAVEDTDYRPSYQSSLMTDTLAMILVAQGAYAEALKAYRTLALAHPARSAHYAAKIEDLERRMHGANSAG